MPNDSGGFVGTLKSKWGPLPVWGWLALVTVVLLGYWLYEQHKNASTASNAPTPATVGQPGVVVINQGDTTTSTTTGTDTDTGKTKPPVPPESTRSITLTKDETLGELAKQRHWSAATLAQVEQMNLTQGQGMWTPSTRLQKGQTVIRPLRG